METLQYLLHGFAVCLTAGNLFLLILGCFAGTVIGILPGIGPTAGTAMLLPLTFGMPPATSIMMLSAIYYGTMYGGTITSVLVNVPGEAASVITCLDGHQMAKKGRAGAALAIAAIGSFVGGTVATMGLVIVALPLTNLALKFGPPEFFAVMAVGLSLATSLASKSLIRALISTVLGLLISSVGIDPVMGVPRFVFGQSSLLDGVGIVPMAMGMFGIAEILQTVGNHSFTMINTRFKDLWFSLQEFRDSVWPIIRGTFIGFFMGLIPGAGAMVPTFMAYAVEKRISKNPEQFGTGRIEGVAAPETANNAYVNAAMIPLFTLGIPGSAVIGILISAFMMNGIIPGPLLIKEYPDLFWSVVASFYVGNLILLIMNLPMIPLFVSLLKIPRPILYTCVLIFCVIGAYSLQSNVFDVGLTLFFGILGYLFKRLDFPVAPMILTVVLGPMMERAMRQSLEMSSGDFSIFFTRPIAVGLIILSVIILITSLTRMTRNVKADTEA